MLKRREVPRFRVNFKLKSNLIKGKGLDISSKGIGFLTKEEIIPADNIPFKIMIKKPFFKNYKIVGIGDLIYSNKISDGNNYRTAIKFKKLNDKSYSVLEKVLKKIN